MTEITYPRTVGVHTKVIQMLLWLAQVGYETLRDVPPKERDEIVNIFKLLSRASAMSLLVNKERITLKREITPNTPPDPPIPPPQHPEKGKKGNAKTPLSRPRTEKPKSTEKARRHINTHR